MNFEERDKEVILNYTMGILSFWENYPSMLNEKSQTHTFLELYARVDDLMKKACLVFYKKEFSSFAVRKHKLEKIVGVFLSDDMNVLLECRRKLSHEIVKEITTNEEVFIREELKKIKFNLPSEYKKHSYSKNDIEEMCWFILFDLTIILSVKSWNSIIGAIKPILDKYDKPLISFTKFFIEGLKQFSMIYYNSRIVYFKKIAEIEAEVFSRLEIK